MHTFERTIGGQRWLLLVSPDTPKALPEKFEGQSWADCQLSENEKDRLRAHYLDVKDVGYAVVRAPSEAAMSTLSRKASDEGQKAKSDD